VDYKRRRMGSFMSRIIKKKYMGVNKRNPRGYGDHRFDIFD